MQVARMLCARSIRPVDSISSDTRCLLRKIMNKSSNTGVQATHPCSLAAHESSTHHTYTVCVEGNVGSGKTTLLNHVNTLKGVEIIQEPVDQWQNVRGHNVLGKMYQDPARWSMALQTYIQLTMMDIHTTPQKEPVRMMERSIHSARHCFVENMHRSGLMPDIEYVILDEWYQWILKSLDVHVDLIVYLRTSPEVCHERIMKRCRNGESSISLELLQNLHTLHEDWLEKKRLSSTPVLMIDANCDVETMFEKYHEQEDVIMGKKGIC